MGDRGGTFCHFRVGTAGTSAAHLRYISRESAVREREAGVLLYRMPPAIHEMVRGEGESGDHYTLLRLSLVAHAWAREAAEPDLSSGKRTCRTHYRATLSFERDIPTRDALALVEAWLRDCFPLARGAAFLHRNTAHVHCHVWLDARGTDGRKLDFSAREYRRLDERWNAFYSPFFGRSPALHLLRKRYGGKERQQGRAPNLGNLRSQWREWERRRAGDDELEKTRTGRVERAASPGTHGHDARERPAPGREQAPPPIAGNGEGGAADAAKAVAAADRAISAAGRLHQALARLGERARQPEQDIASDYERER